MRLIFLNGIIIVLTYITYNRLTQDYFEKDFYEKVSGIRFPEDYETIATADNGEFVTIAILDLERSTCEEFYHNNSFRPITDKFIPPLIGLKYLDSNYRQLPEKSKLLRNWGHKEKTNWTYLIDTTTCRLYCEILYSDWSGQ